MEKKILLFSNKNNCCGCGACLNICPKDAIEMKVDEFGFEYPEIDEQLCIHCGLCKTVCDYQDMSDLHLTKEAYAGASKNISILKKSASGGVFSTLAKNILDENGIVYGVSMDNIDSILMTRHIRIKESRELDKLQGSKYVQSSTGYTFRLVKEDLEKGFKVLYSGTPCQIAGLKKFLKKKYRNLVTIEIICHGVPSGQMFQDFIKGIEINNDIKIQEFKFRDKSKGQGMVSNIKYKTKKGEVENCIKNGKTISYFSLFLKSLIYRENCYSCPYAQEERCADITLGDYWGFHQEHPDEEKMAGLSNSNGVSCILVNTEIGINFISKYKSDLILVKSEFEKISRHNDQLKLPSQYNKKRDLLLNLYKEKGYKSVEQYYKDNYKIDRFKQNIIYLIPKDMRRISQKIIGLIKKD
ncbi:4Fe-4S dicluster domain-containing protein [Clostridium perfringens]|uniref:Coenzyme F420 hydrogenase/dehydrogenase, beta subunit C-terminal domain n=1 Tax=Clostridium perfringens TaxID=1502 RepID=UPI0028FECB91|nr:4Fe-4S dicluster domain-containing protein [Clostridium perfringens]EHA1184363.1 4Fe-4S dicluster domain-containing protein [Clostridium perfringens]EHK2367097.1 Coenzyme F420 hydrogenase/dehydrogenase, beta subunit C-terminal domain [Clostridium perfringens]MDU2325155.1 Coenzyme F420 hydrogenase/dehydrogenase, beta subunit C-terminal domain [Clostridium perfringens]